MMTRVATGFAAAAILATGLGVAGPASAASTGTPSQATAKIVCKVSATAPGAPTVSRTVQVRVQGTAPLATDIAKALDITVAQLKADTAAGETIEQIATAKGISEATFTSTLEQLLKATLESEAAKANLTPAQMTKLVAALDKVIPSLWTANLNALPAGLALPALKVVVRASSASQVSATTSVSIDASQALADIAQALGITVAQLKADTAAGQTIEQIATAKGVSESAFTSALDQLIKTAVDKAAAKANLTSAQANKLMAALDKIAASLWTQNLQTLPKLPVGVLGRSVTVVSPAGGPIGPNVPFGPGAPCGLPGLVCGGAGVIAPPPGAPASSQIAVQGVTISAKGALADIAQALDITVAQLKADIEAGKTVEQIATAKGISQSAFTGALDKLIETVVDAQAGKANLTPAQVTKVLSALDHLAASLWTSNLSGLLTKVILSSGGVAVRARARIIGGPGPFGAFGPGAPCGPATLVCAGPVLKGPPGAVGVRVRGRFVGGPGQFGAFGPGAPCGPPNLVCRAVAVKGPPGAVVGTQVSVKGIANVSIDPTQALADIAQALGITVAQLKADGSAGQTIEQIATAKGITESAFTSTLDQIIQTAIDAQVSKGNLTQAQATALLPALEKIAASLWTANPTALPFGSATKVQVRVSGGPGPFGPGPACALPAPPVAKQAQSKSA
jgi:uncharacterized protein YpbB